VIVPSADGTPIEIERFGDGPALVIVPGALSDHIAWMACAPLLANGRSVHMIDRRGRGASGDAPSYEPERAPQAAQAGAVRAAGVLRRG
jgi:pimeloyl-ACP methyl ester carboxylesterase